ncbi:unnamed protein product [Gadus morhua 'NCC']
MAGNPVDERFRGLDFAHSPEMLRMFNNIFGLHEFRDNQLEAINATILNKNVFVVGGNGAGKSLCYQLPACLSRGVTVVISPTISLIRDQIQHLNELGIEAWTPPDYQGYSDEESIDEQSLEIVCQLSKIKLLYVTPEKVRMSRPLINALRDQFAKGLLARFVIDEAQCIIEWGNVFRPDYGKLNELQQDFKGVPMIAVSGPTRPQILAKILNQLQMNNRQEASYSRWPDFRFTMNFNPTNLKYAVKPKTLDGGTDCITWIKEHYPHKSGIVYCWKSEYCDQMAKTLNEAGLQACSYHAGTTDRDSVQNRWKENKCQVICATVAFGMGIHKPDVRYVIHSFLPKSMEHYHRETGRAGRDGNVSHCILFFSGNDEKELSFVIRGTNEPMSLQPMVVYCRNTVVCRRRQLHTYFAGVDTEANSCNENAEAICDNCERANAATSDGERICGEVGISVLSERVLEVFDRLPFLD